MAEVLTRVYKYTGQSSWKAGHSSVPLSAFTITGSERPITEILSVQVTVRRKQRTTSNVTHTARLVFANGADTLTSASVTKRDSSARGEWTIPLVFPVMPSAADWTAGNVTVATRIDTKVDEVDWIASETYPMLVTITYKSTEFIPGIAPVMYRASSSGSAADAGTNITFAARLALQKTGANGSGRLAIYEGLTADAGANGNLIYEQTGIAASVAGIEVVQAPLQNHTQAMGDKRYYYVLFSYTAETDAGDISTEAVGVTLFIGSVFTNVHLAGVGTGGVAFGKFSAATPGNPLFECVYPAVFGGKVRFDGGIEEILDYRTTEVKTGCTWIDGKPIYRCVIEVGAKTASAMYVDVTNLDIETYVDLRGMFYASADYGSGYVYPAPYAAMSESYMLGLEAASRTSIRINSSTRTWSSGFLVLEYTKV